MIDRELVMSMGMLVMINPLNVGCRRKDGLNGIGVTTPLELSKVEAICTVDVALRPLNSTFARCAYACEAESAAIEMAATVVMNLESRMLKPSKMNNIQGDGVKLETWWCRCKFFS